MKQENKILFLIVIAQFAGTSLWFAVNAVIPDLQKAYQFGSGAVGHVTSAVQLGFIAGTLVFSLLTLPDRYPPSRIFFLCSVLAAGANLLTLFSGESLPLLLTVRAVTGFLLAGIYPVGMKIASDYFEKGLGKALGLLLGALVLGTAFPHLVKTLTESFPWKYVITFTSYCALAGGTLILLLVPDGPHRKKSSKLNLLAFLEVYKEKNLRAAALGYFGHMWELYAFWAFVPVILTAYGTLHPEIVVPVPLLSFIIIASGAVTCAAGGFFAERFGNARVAFTALLCSGACCLASPLLFNLPFLAFLSLLVFWGATVSPDSPQFSTLVARFAPSHSTGTALTMTNCIGFSITIISIQILNVLSEIVDKKYLFLLLALGPILGLISMRALIRKIPSKYEEQPTN